MKTEEIKTEESKSKGGDKSKVVLLVIVFLFLLSLLSYFAFTGDFFSEYKPSKEEGVESVPDGEIFLTLAPIGTDKPNIYKLDVESMVLEEYLPNEENYANFMGNFSSDLNKMVFVRLYREGVFQIMLFDSFENEYKEITEKSENFPRNPQFSFDSTKVVYWTFEDETSASAEYPEDNNIYTVGLNGSKNFVANGAFPVFSPDDSKILYLKNDGLYLLDLETSEEFLALNVRMDYFDEIINEREKEEQGLEGWMSLRFTYSPTSNVLAITDTLGSDLYFFEILNWDNFEYNEILERGVVGANWPTFSPTGLFLAFQESEIGDSRNFISIIDIETSSFVESLELVGFDSNYIWISDWIIR